MSNAPTTSLPPGHAAKLAVLLDAVDSVPLTEGDRGLLTWLGRFRPVHRGA